MKKLFLILGGIVCILFIIAAMYVALTIGISCYLAWGNQQRMKKYEAYRAALESGQIQPPAPGQPWGPDAKPAPAPPPPPKLEPLFTDPGNFGNEDNWLATMISREIASMAFFAVHPDQPVPELKVRAQVDPDKPQVHVDITGFGNGDDAQIGADLTPVFAWDNEGYAPLATRLLGTTTGAAPEPDSAITDVLTHLLRLTASELALEDMRISADLQKNPTSWQAHEQAAVLLIAMALREEAGISRDSRLLLSRATAHLAIAQALRGNQPVSWPGLIADAGVRALSGREVDALAHLDTLAARTDCPDAAKTWIAALRTYAKEDWREANITPQSPLLLKIVWFRATDDDLIEDVATKRLEQIVPQPDVDPSAPPDPDKANPETLVADWGRIAGVSPYNGAPGDDVGNAKYKLDLELHELGDILTTEGAPNIDISNLAQLFSEPETDTVANDSTGKPIVRVIGPATFKADTLRHLLAGVPDKSPIPVASQDPAQMEIFLTKIDTLFKGIASYEIFELPQRDMDPPTRDKACAQLAADGKTVPVWQACYDMGQFLPGYDRVKAFYARAEPFGTVYDPGNRMTYITAIGATKLPESDPTVLEKIKKLPIDQQVKEINDYRNKYQAMLRAIPSKGPTAYVQSLRALDPDLYELFGTDAPTDQLLKLTGRFMDYRMDSIEQVERLDADHLSDADREMVLRKHVLFQPEFNVDLGLLLRSEGRDAEAVAAERNGLAQAGPEWASTFYERIVDYDLDHGLTDEALALGKKASADVSDEEGLDSYFDALEATGQLDQAKTVAHEVTEKFDDTWPEIVLFSGHADKFPDDAAAEEKRIFPNGIQKADLSSFSGPPEKGMRLDDDGDDQRTKWMLKPAHLQQGDIMVALAGYRIDTAMQYFFIQARGHGPDMNFIVWRDGKYQEVKAYVPHRRFLLSVDQIPAS